MTTAIIFLIGRIIFGVYWIEVAYSHFKNTAMLAGYAQSKGVKGAKAGVIISGIFALIGGLSVLLGVWPRVGLLFIALFLIGVTFKIHTYWKVTDPQAKQMDKVQFKKNIALLGATLIIYAIALPWTWSI